MSVNRSCSFLPTEIWAEIGSYLPTEELARWGCYTPEERIAALLNAPRQLRSQSNQLGYSVVQTGFQRVFEDRLIRRFNELGTFPEEFKILTHRLQSLLERRRFEITLISFHLSTSQETVHNFQKFPDLTALDLNVCNFDGNVAKAMPNSVKRLRLADSVKAETVKVVSGLTNRLEMLFVSGGEVGLYGVSFLSKASYIDSLRQLQLANCGLDAEALKVIIKINFTGLQFLSLSGNNLGNAVALLRRAKWPTLQELDLSSNRIDHITAEDLICDYLEYNERKAIERGLSLSAFHDKDSANRFIDNFLSRKENNIRWVDLADNQLPRRIFNVWANKSINYIFNPVERDPNAREVALRSKTYNYLRVRQIVVVIQDPYHEDPRERSVRHKEWSTVVRVEDNTAT